MVKKQQQQKKGISSINVWFLSAFLYFSHLCCWDLYADVQVCRAFFLCFFLLLFFIWIRTMKKKKRKRIFRSTYLIFHVLHGNKVICLNNDNIYIYILSFWYRFTMQWVWLAANYKFKSFINVYITGLKCRSLH